MRSPVNLGTASETLQHVLPESGETLDQLAARVRAAGYKQFVRESGGILLGYSHFCIKEPRDDHANRTKD